MAQDKTFDFTDVSFPEGAIFRRLKKLLTSVATSSHLRATLDDLIRFILETEEVIKDSKYKDHREYLLELLDNKFYPLADALCDEDVTYEKLLIIKAKRKITTSYLPNHFFGQEPEFVPLATYQRDDNTWKQEEKRFKKKHLLHTAISLAPLFKKAYPLKRAEEPDTMAAASVDSSEAPPPHLLKLRENYLEQEALAKMISNFRVRRSLHDKDGVKLLLVYQLGRYRDFSLPGFDEATAILQKYRQAYLVLKNTMPTLQDSLETIDVAFVKLQEAFEQEKLRLKRTSASTQEINAAVLQHLATVRHTIWCMSKEIENLHHGVYQLGAIRKALVAATPYHPGQLSGFIKFIRENQDYFSRERPNNFLRVNYFYTDEQREKYRVHIIKGKCYRIVRSYGKIKFVPFSTTEETSHRKKGWVSFVMNRNGEIFAGSHDEMRNLLHSSFMAGAPVFFPGEMKTAPDGTIQEVSNYSGHYGPNLEAMEAFACHLSQKRQVDVSSINFYAVDAKGLQDSLDKVDQTPDLPKDVIEKAKEALENQSEELKGFRKCYRLVNDKFNEIDLPVDSPIPVEDRPYEIKEKTASSASTPETPVSSLVGNAKPASVKSESELSFERVVWIGALTMMVVVGIVLAASAILATKGIAAPFIGGLMIKAAALGSASGMVPALPAVGTVATLLIAVPTLVLNNIFGWTQSLGKWLGGLFGSKNSEAPAATRTSSRPVEQVAKTPSEVPAPNPPSPPEKKADPQSYPTIVKRIIEETAAAKIIDNMAVTEKPVPIQPAQTISSITRVPLRRLDEGRTVSTFIGQKRKYGEWTKFESDMDKIAHKDPNNKHGFAIYLNWLKSDLEGLQKKVLRSQDGHTLDSQEILKKWAGGNVVQLMLDVANKLKDEQEFLVKVEQEFFKPLDAIISEFWQPFQTKPVEVLRAYQLQRANVLVVEQPSVVAP